MVRSALTPRAQVKVRFALPGQKLHFNVESEIWRRHAETKTGRVDRFLYDVQYRRMLRYEDEALARFDGVLAVSDADRQKMQAAVAKVLNGRNPQDLSAEDRAKLGAEIQKAMATGGAKPAGDAKGGESIHAFPLTKR